METFVLCADQMWSLTGGDKKVTKLCEGKMERMM
jgi:hypothetical protein